MEVVGIMWFLAEAGVVIGQETRQQLIAGGNRDQRREKSVNKTQNFGDNSVKEVM
jgi:hypothetical protein